MLLTVVFAFFVTALTMLAFFLFDIPPQCLVVSTPVVTGHFKLLYWLHPLLLQCLRLIFLTSPNLKIACFSLLETLRSLYMVGLSFLATNAIFKIII